ncbi:uncharacterized protein C8A04DRAFT_9448 [Dichotomopilus funicola]|uniref:Uncharacterized protein n=1 Tax=Dichotomopilus funicola TaxID=1934379 RepID=A0AAN6ZQX0_9PEZI|nr:hypothetical protein C8A04DRAFT_9448 [Dichotomopilus funicola]
MAPDGELSRALNGEGPPSGSPARHPSISLQAAATLNAGLQRESPGGSPNSPLSPRNQSPHTDRRRSQVLMNLQMADPSMPAPGEMVSDSQGSQNGQNASSPVPIAASPRLAATNRIPYHSRAPSLGELHQELENEQEFQVNRLLAQIRDLQAQVQRQQQQNPSAVTGDEASDRSVPTSAAPVPIPVPGAPGVTSSPQPIYPGSGSLPRSPVFPRTSFDMARADLRHRSRTPSRNASPRMRSTSISADSGEQWALGGRDDCAFYQAEAQMLVRENQMLRHRIRELERKLFDTHGSNDTSASHEPPHSSRLNHSVSVSDDDGAKVASPAATGGPSAKIE